MDGARWASPGEPCRRTRPGRGPHRPCCCSPRSAQRGGRGPGKATVVAGCLCPGPGFPGSPGLPARGLGAKSSLVCIRQTDRRTHTQKVLLSSCQGQRWGGSALADFNLLFTSGTWSCSRSRTLCLTPSLRLPDRVTPHDILTGPTVHGQEAAAAPGGGRRQGLRHARVSG